MIRPTSLLRSDSDHAAQFSVPTVSIQKGTIDCGITILPCCLPPWFHQFATPKIFLLFLVILAICQGSAQAYFAATLPYIKEIYDYPPVVIEWLLVSHDIFLGLFGFLVAHYGLKIHRAAWIGGLACLQGTTCFLVIIPYLERAAKSNIEINTGPNMCKEERPYLSSNLEIINNDSGNAIITLIVLFLIQLLNGLSNASFYSHGFSYLDDNIKKKNSPVYLAILIAVRMSFIQFGSFMAWSLLSQGKAWWIGYPIIGSLLIIFGTFVATFPRNLLSTVMEQTVATILERVRGNSSQSLDEIDETPKTGLVASLRRVFTNRILVINTFSSVFLYMAIDNFSSYEAKYMEAEFYIPEKGEGFNDPWKSRLVRNIMKLPVIALCVLISGLAIAKFKPRTTRLASWNVLASMIVASIFISFAFVGCEKGKLVEEYKHQLVAPMCSRACNCAATSTKFEPVCTEDGKNTYYSPCHAGCNEIMYINNLRYYSNCTCSTYKPRRDKLSPLATEGACDNEKCALYWRLFQGLSVLSAGLIASGYVGNLLITLRTVLPSDKSMAIAYELCFAGILVHIPGKFMYDLISDKTCKYLSYDSKSCSLHGEKFGEILTLLTACLIFVSILMDCLVVYFARDLKIFDSEDDDANGGNRPKQPVTRQQSSRFSTIQSSPEPSNPEQRRPPRPRSSLRYSTAEVEPLNSTEDQEMDERPPMRRSLSPQGFDGRPLNSANAQRDLIQEFKQRKSTRI